MSNVCRLFPPSSPFEYVTRVPGGTELVTQVLEPITESWPITVLPPRIVAPAHPREAKPRVGSTRVFYARRAPSTLQTSVIFPSMYIRRVTRTTSALIGRSQFASSHRIVSSTARPGPKRSVQCGTQFAGA